MDQSFLNQKLSAIVIGGTGASGRDIISLLLKSPKWGKVYVPARRKIDRFLSLSKEELDKLRFIEVPDLDFLASSKEEISKVFGEDLEKAGIHTVFCCLGSRTKYGKEEFYKVDYTYVVNSSNLNELFNIPHYSLVSTGSADSNSMFYYLSTKGKAEDTLRQRFNEKKIQTLTIHQPGLITDRDNDTRVGELFLKWVPFLPKIKCIELAGGMVKEAERVFSDYKSYGNRQYTYPNKQILALNQLNL